MSCAQARPNATLRLQCTQSQSLAFFLLGSLHLVAAPLTCSEPVGFLKAQVHGASELGPALHSFGIPFQRNNVFQGGVTHVRRDEMGRCEIRCGGPGWQPSQWTVVPHFAKLRSGPGAGRLFFITGTTADALNLQIPNDVLLENVVRTNDVLEVFPANTLASIFGTGAATVVATGTSAADADLVRLHDGSSWTSYFHNGTHWRRVESDGTQDHLALRPEQGLLFVRRSKNTLSLPLGGSVGVRAELTTLPDSGEALLAYRWPLASTLQSLNLHKLVGWKSAPAAAQADKVLLWNGTFWDAFYHSGTRWEKSGSFASQDNVLIPKTSALLVRRSGAGGEGLWSLPVPFVYP
jgi:uncharacterized protein (TIGR02597 family)